MESIVAAYEYAEDIRNKFKDMEGARHAYLSGYILEFEKFHTVLARSPVYASRNIIESVSGFEKEIYIRSPLTFFL